MKPTDEQTKWFWEQCGFKQSVSKRDYHWKWGNKVQHWIDPLTNKITKEPLGIGRLPTIDLNSLFKYAVPILLEKFGKQKLVEMVNRAVCNAVEAKLYGQEGIPNHLFGEFFKAFGGDNGNNN